MTATTAESKDDAPIASEERVLNAHLVGSVEGKGEEVPVEIFRKDYKPLAYTVSKLSMDFRIFENKTIVASKLTVERNKNVEEDGDLELDGEEDCVKLHSLQVNDRDLGEGEYELKPGKLVLASSLLGERCEIRTVASIVPETNTQLTGLYKSGCCYCTQCEAMGFRRITYYPDRPDIMSVFESIRIEASRTTCPVLLSNGNIVETGEIPDTDRHFAIWSDPFPKPCYLFCLVAGDLGHISDSFTVNSGRATVKLQIYSEHENVGKLQHAMKSLKNAMKWDEDTFGLEYDLDLYNIVAVNDFNMGAMENKGLNVFNTAYVLADPQTATDVDYENIEGVIGHEYFHNWTGNRVTCLDWFQLTLKEGLTVYRDQSFSADMTSAPVKRIEDVRMLRARQFAEDAGPMSHPIRPESYIAMDNFYTATVYVKGAEIIRMYETLLTKAGFRKGMDLYFQRHDGSAVTCDDFRAAMADANGVDLGQFGLWYSTSGTPTVTYSSTYADGTFTLTLSQTSKSDKPLHVPISVGLLDKATGEEVVPTKVLELKEMTQEFSFPGLKGDVIPSMLRNFSAPVKLVSASGVEDEEAMAFLAANDTDHFNKWEAGQNMYMALIFQYMKDEKSDTTLGRVLEAFRRVLTDRSNTDYSIQAYTLTLPTESTLEEELEVVDPIAIRKARKAVRKELASNCQAEIRELYDALTSAMEKETEFKVDATAIGRRRLRNVLLAYLCCLRDTAEERTAVAKLAMGHFKSAICMTDKEAALSCLASMDQEGAAYRDEALQKFYDDAKGAPLVIDKWFRAQALADLPDILDRVKALRNHPDFSLTNPNRVRSLIGAFTMNPAAFHEVSGEGYEFIGSFIGEFDKVNAQVASKVAARLITWKKYNEERGLKMKGQLQKLADMKPVSKETFEIVSRGLK